MDGWMEKVTLALDRSRWKPEGDAGAYETQLENGGGKQLVAEMDDEILAAGAVRLAEKQQQSN